MLEMSGCPIISEKNLLTFVCMFHMFKDFNLYPRVKNGVCSFSFNFSFLIDLNPLCTSAGFWYPYRNIFSLADELGIQPFTKWTRSAFYSPEGVEVIFICMYSKQVNVSLSSKFGRENPFYFHFNKGSFTFVDF